MIRANSSTTNVGVNENKMRGSRMFGSKTDVSRPSMTIREKVLMSSYEKWVKYRIVPIKEILHIILVILTTWQVVILNSRDMAYRRACSRNWNFFFLPSDYDFSTDFYYIYEYKAAVAAVEGAVSGYYHINETSVDYFGYYFNNKNEVVEPLLRVNSYYFPKSNSTDDDIERERLSQSNFQLITTEYSLKEGDFTNLMKVHRNEGYFFDNLVDMTLEFSLSNFAVLSNRATCYVWFVSVYFDFSSRGHLTLSVNSDIDGYCVQKPYLFDFGDWDDMMWITVSTIFVSCLFIIFFVVHIAKTWRLYLLVLESESFLIWQSLPIMKRIRLFNPWFFLSFLATCLVMTSCVLYIVGQTTSFFTDPNVRSISLGGGCGILWISLVKYLSHNKRFFAMIMTLYRGAPRVAQFVSGVIPIFLGYVLCGMTLFGNHSESFSGVKVACVTLFSLLNGDSVRAIFQELYIKFPVSSQIFLYSFISLFIYVALNICIVIIEETFYSIRPTKAALGGPQQGGGIGDIGGRAGYVDASSPEGSVDARMKRMQDDPLHKMLHMLEETNTGYLSTGSSNVSLTSMDEEQRNTDPVLISLINQDIISLSVLHDSAEEAEKRRRSSTSSTSYNPPSNLNNAKGSEKAPTVSLQTRIKQDLAAEYNSLLTNISQQTQTILRNETGKTFPTQLEAHEWISSYTLLHFKSATEHVRTMVVQKLEEVIRESEKEKERQDREVVIEEGERKEERKE